ncbi:MAG TPA: hypothetical protein VMI94_20620 [Bryobacteraceae bacterium]|nr:hypothetical protein [Bryobacteraceae bacterium]
MRIQVISLCALALSGGLVSGSAAATAEPGHAHDRIVVLSHFPLAGGSVGRLVAAGHYNRHYLYAEQNGKKLTVIDITDPTRPFRTAGISYPGNSGSGDLVAAAGTAALVVSSAAAHSPAPAETVRIMSFADPAHPRVSREF